MKTKYQSLMLLSVCLSVFLSSCTVVEQRPSPAHAVYVQTPPPNEIIETQIPPPDNSGFWVWQRGHWRWNGFRYFWSAGHWVRRPANYNAWIAPHWEARGNGWIFFEGRWQ